MPSSLPLVRKWNSASKPHGEEWRTVTVRLAILARGNLSLDREVSPRVGLGRSTPSTRAHLASTPSWKISARSLPNRRSIVTAFGNSAAHAQGRSPLTTCGTRNPTTQRHADCLAATSETKKATSARPASRLRYRQTCRSRFICAGATSLSFQAQPAPSLSSGLLDALARIEMNK